MKALRTIDTVPKAVLDALRGVSVHGTLAAQIALDETEDYAIWKTVLPTRQEFEAGMPIMWPKELQQLLPRRARDLFDKSLAGFRKDCEAVLKAFPQLTYDDYMYSWVMINTRTFYNKMPKMKTYSQEDRLVCMPVADLFNHADQGCQLVFSSEGYSVVTNREYDADSEVFLSYGSHSNDFLLTEYGFILETNRWDDVYLDDVILPKLSKAQKEDLEEAHFLGRYTLDEQTQGCHRTQVALRRICCTEGQWMNFLEGRTDGAASQREVNKLLAAALEDLVQRIDKTLNKIEETDAGSEDQRELLTRRWKQIETMVQQALGELI